MSYGQDSSAPRSGLQNCSPHQQAVEECIYRKRLVYKPKGVFELDETYLKAGLKDRKRLNRRVG